MIKLYCEMCHNSLWDVFHNTNVYTALTTKDGFVHIVCALDANHFMISYAGDILEVRHVPEIMGG